MFFSSGQAFREWPSKAVTLIGMSGAGKTYLSNFLSHTVKDWYHYNVDYRIGSFYLREDITNILHEAASSHPLLYSLMLKDAVCVEPRLSIDNLAVLSAYLGKPGDPARGGLDLGAYNARQDRHRNAEISALKDMPVFLENAKKAHGYTNFICDTSGSICEIVDPYNSSDEVLNTLFESSIIIYLQGSDSNKKALIDRFLQSPKPIYYNKSYFASLWSEYLRCNGIQESEVDPDAFSCWAFQQLIDARLPKYQAISENWGYTVHTKDLETCRTYTDIESLISCAIEEKAHYKNAGCTQNAN